jgi:hypothetical protein
MVHDFVFDRALLIKIIRDCDCDCAPLIKLISDYLDAWVLIWDNTGTGIC